MAVSISTGFVGAILGSQSFEQIFLNGSIEVRSGGQPAGGADAAATGVLLARVTREGGAWSADSPANGLQFARAGRYAMKVLAHEWRLTGIAVGTAGWFRLVGNAADNGLASVELPRIDGSLALLPEEGDAPSPAQMFLASLAITPSTDLEIGQWYLTLP